MRGLVVLGEPSPFGFRQPLVDRIEVGGEHLRNPYPRLGRRALIYRLDHKPSERFDLVGRASADKDAQDADAALERAQAELDSAIRAFTGLQDEPAALERLTELRMARDAARAEADRLRGLSAALTVTAARDWDALTVAERRGLIRATVARVLVSPGRGGGRVRVLFVE